MCTQKSAGNEDLLKLNKNNTSGKVFLVTKNI